MIVTPDTFRKQLQIVKELFEPISLAEWISRRTAGKALPDRACAITFDDGWLDNYEFAFPILQQEQVPATLFAVSHMVGTNRQFWPNRLARVLNARTPAIDLRWLGPHLQQLPPGPLGREQLAELVRHCKSLPDQEMHQHLDDAERELDLQAVAEPALVNWDQLRQLQQSGLVEIGSHTCSHYRLLDSLPLTTLEQEIRESHHLLERELSRPVTLFCYPNGDSCAEALRLVRQYYKAAVTTKRGINTVATAPHELLRIGIHEDASNTPVQFRARLSGWI